MTGRPALWASLLPSEHQGDDWRCAISAHGVRLRFADGHEELCATSGLWNVNLGYGNEAIAESVAAALRDASYLSVFRYENSYARAAARALVELAGADHYSRVLFSTSGGAANDLMMKVARHYQVLCGFAERKVIVGLRGSYHGLTYGAFGLTGEDLGQPFYAVDQRLVRHVQPNDPEEFTELMRRQGRLVAAVVVEPVLGTGAIPLTADYISLLLELRDQYGFLLVADEVATGFGRTGPVFASQEWPGQPDLLIASKGLTNGTQAAAVVLVADAVAKIFDRHGAVIIHGETQAGTPASCAAILATIDQMHELNAVPRGRELAVRLEAALADLAVRQPMVAESTGTGCFRAVRLTVGDEPLPQHQVPNVIAAIRRAGAVVHPGPHGFQLIPALTYTEADLAELFDCIHKGLDVVAAELATSEGRSS